MVVFPITEVIGASNDHTTPPYIAAPARVATVVAISLMLVYNKFIIAWGGV